MLMLEHCLSIANDALRQAFRFSNARTYARTHRDILTLLCYLTLVSARRGAARFTQMWMKRDFHADSSLTHPLTHGRHESRSTGQPDGKKRHRKMETR